MTSQTMRARHGLAATVSTVTRRLIVAVGIIALVFGAVLFSPFQTPTSHAQEQELGQEKKKREATSEVCDGTYGDLKWKEGASGPGVVDGVYVGEAGKDPQNAQLEFTWAFPLEVDPGAVIKFTLPDELEAMSDGVMELKNPQGEVVATGVWVGKTFIITATDFASTNFGLAGSVYLNVRWDKDVIDPNKGFDGDLEFTGCPVDPTQPPTLPGKYIPHPKLPPVESKKEAGDYRNAGDSWLVDWKMTFGLPENPEQPFIVRDEAPLGSEFVCDGDYSFYPGGSPVGLSPTMFKMPDGTVEYGTATGFTNVTRPLIPADKAGDAFELSCTPDAVTLTIAAGVRPNGNDRIGHLNLITITSKENVSDIPVTNTAVINGTPVSASKRLPSSGGTGEGSLGAFTITKELVGIESDESFDFAYQCVNERGVVRREGEVSLAGGEAHSVTEVEKNLDCTITEVAKDIEGYTLDTTWSAEDTTGEGNFTVTDAGATFKSVTPSAGKIAVTATNTYTPVPTGGFIVNKVVAGDAAELVEGKEFDFNWRCTAPAGEVSEGDLNVAAGASAEVEGLADGSSCVVTEGEASLEGATHELDLSVNGDVVEGDEAAFIVGSEEGGLVTVQATNTYTHERGVELPLPETGQGAALWSLLAMTGGMAAGVVAWMLYRRSQIGA